MTDFDPTTTAMLREAREAPQVVARLLDANGPLCRALGERLRKAPPADDDVRRTLEVVDLVLSRDPLASRIGATERRTRLLADFGYATQRNAACVARNSPQPTGGDEVLEDEIRTYGETLRVSPLEQDTIESGVDLMARIARRVETACGPATAMDQALLLIARQHASASP